MHWEWFIALFLLWLFSFSILTWAQANSSLWLVREVTSSYSTWSSAMCHCFHLYSCHWILILPRNSNLELWFQRIGKAVQRIVDHGYYLRGNKSKKIRQSLAILSFWGTKKHQVAKVKGFCKQQPFFQFPVTLLKTSYMHNNSKNVVLDVTSFSFYWNCSSACFYCTFPCIFQSKWHLATIARVHLIFSLKPIKPRNEKGAAGCRQLNSSCMWW